MSRGATTGLMPDAACRRADSIFVPAEAVAQAGHDDVVERPRCTLRPAAASRHRYQRHCGIDVTVPRILV
jgi:hypothetical protein